MKAEVVSMTADKLDMEAIQRGGEILRLYMVLEEMR